MTQKNTIKFAVEECRQRSNKLLFSTSGRNPKTPKNRKLAFMSQDQSESCCKIQRDTWHKLFQHKAFLKWNIIRTEVLDQLIQVPVESLSAVYNASSQLLSGFQPRVMTRLALLRQHIFFRLLRIILRIHYNNNNNKPQSQAS